MKRATKLSAPSPTCTSSSSATTASSTRTSLKVFAGKAPWQGQHRGEVERLKPEYRLALARDGYALVKSELAVFKPEAL